MKYRPAVDLLRILSAAAIVCFHAHGSPDRQYTITGLAVFILLTFALQVQAAGQPAFGDFVRKRSQRLLLPWLVWSLIYLIVPLKLTGFAGMDLNWLLIGPTIHLWFLPFAFVGGVVVYFLDSFSRRTSAHGAVGVMIGLIVALSLPMKFTAHATIPSPWAQWLYAAPMMPLAVVMGISRRSNLISPLLAVCVVSGGISAYTRDPSYFLGTVLLALAFVVEFPASAIVYRLARYSMGIYLIHPMVFLICSKFLKDPNWMILFFAGFVGSLAASAVICQSAVLDKMMFGTVPTKNPLLPRGEPAVESSAEGSNDATLPLGRPVH